MPLIGCNSQSCKYARPTGQANNGPCMCARYNLISTQICNQEEADRTLALCVEQKVKSVTIFCFPLLENIDFSEWFNKVNIEEIVISGSVGPKPKLLNVDWIRDIIRQFSDSKTKISILKLGAMPCEGELRLNTDYDYVTSTEKQMPSGTYWLGTGRFLNLNDPEGSDYREWPEDLQPFKD